MNLIALDFNQGQNNARERYIIIAKDLRTPVFPFEFTIKHLRPKCCDMVLFIQVIYASESNIPVPVNHLPWKLCKPEVCSYASQNGPTNDVFDANKKEITRNGLVFTFQEHLLPACEHFRGAPPFFVLYWSSTPLKEVAFSL